MNSSSVTISDALFSACPSYNDRAAKCVAIDCGDIAVEVSGRFFIRFGHAGFNLPANNRNGYATAAAASRASRECARKAAAARFRELGARQ